MENLINKLMEGGEQETEKARHTNEHANEVEINYDSFAEDVDAKNSSGLKLEPLEPVVEIPPASVQVNESKSEERIAKLNGLILKHEQALNKVNVEVLQLRDKIKELEAQLRQKSLENEETMCQKRNSFIQENEMLSKHLKMLENVNKTLEKKLRMYEDEKVELERQLNSSLNRNLYDFTMLCNTNIEMVEQLESQREKMNEIKRQAKFHENEFRKIRFELTTLRIENETLQENNTTLRMMLEVYKEDELKKYRAAEEARHEESQMIEQVLSDSSEPELQKSQLQNTPLQMYSLVSSSSVGDTLLFPYFSSKKTSPRYHNKRFRESTESSDNKKTRLDFSNTDCGDRIPEYLLEPSLKVEDSPSLDQEGKEHQKSDSTVEVAVQEKQVQTEITVSKETDDDVFLPDSQDDYNDHTMSTPIAQQSSLKVIDETLSTNQTEPSNQFLKPSTQQQQEQPQKQLQKQLTNAPKATRKALTPLHPNRMPKLKVTKKPTKGDTTAKTSRR